MSNDWAKSSIKIADFFEWLQGNEVAGYEPWIRNGKPNKVSYGSARTTAYSAVRGFYTNNEVLFPKTWRVPPARLSKVTQSDEAVPLFTESEENGSVGFERGLIQHFLANLKLRDQSVFLAKLATSADGVDLFKLTVGWARQQAKRRRFYWAGTRTKTRMPFKVFFSVEATEFTRRYMEQERAEAEDQEPLWMTATGKPMTAKNITDIFKSVAEKMGINGNGGQNPLRPKRLRSAFRTAATHAGVDTGFIHVFMGHKTDVSEGYLKKPVTILEHEYRKIEPMLSVYSNGESKEYAQLADELQAEKVKRAELIDKLDGFQRELEKLRDTVATMETLNEWLEELEKRGIRKKDIAYLMANGRQVKQE